MKRTIRELLHVSVINLDKPSGPTCRVIDEEVKNLFNLKKVGHAGTLDNGASGVLLVALDEATKAMPVLMGLDKEYEGTMYLHKDVDLNKLKEVISEDFIGKITQIPPVKSRVARKPRKRMVYSFDILGRGGKDVKFRTKVEAGTYIRKLIHDIGEKLGMGAHMKKLRRTKVGHFCIENSHTLEEVKNGWKSGKLEKILIPIENAISHVKRVYVKDSAILRIRNGSPIFSSGLIRVQDNIKAKETVGIFSSDDRLIALGIAKYNTKTIKIRRGESVVKTDRVFVHT